MYSVNCLRCSHEGGVKMELVGKLKEQVEKTESKDEAKKVIEEAGMLLTDEELDNVAGGNYIDYRLRNNTLR